jgi:uncharacterized protein
MKKILVVALLFFPVFQVYGEAFKAEDVKFMSNGVQLSGAIVFPKEKEVRAAIVFVHGSGKEARNLFWAERFADKGIATLVYDKRGVGKSGGKYESEQSVGEKNISLLADDAASALEALSRHPALKGVIPTGNSGYLTTELQSR